MYEWIEEVSKVVKGLSGKDNDTSTRIDVAKKIIEILNKHGVHAFVDCSTQVNTSDVVNNGDFHAKVSFNNLEILFKYQEKK